LDPDIPATNYLPSHWEPFDQKLGKRLHLLKGKLGDVLIIPRKSKHKGWAGQETRSPWCHAAIHPPTCKYL